MADRAVLLTIENNREITPDSDPEFWYVYQQSVLLALKEKGVLNEMQYRCAGERLKRQRGG